MAYHFGGFELQEHPLQLRREGKALAAKRSILQTLLYLLDNRAKIVTRDDLIEHVWHGTIVSDAAIAKRIEQVRKLLGESGKDQRFIKTVYGRGFLFEGDARHTSEKARFASPAPGDGAGPHRDSGGLGVPQSQLAGIERFVCDGLSVEVDEIPSVAVLPLKRISPAGPYDRLAEGLPDELITSLTQLRWLFVIARGSTFRFPSYEHRLSTIGQELQARYCVSGTMEILEDRLFVSIELSETIGETAIWREHYETDVRGAHELRDELVYKVASELDRRITQQEIIRARLKNPRDLNAWGAYHSGLGKIYSYNSWDLDGALADFERAVEIDPHFARGYAGLAQTRWLRTIQYPLEQRPAEAMAMLAAAKQAEELDPLDPAVVTAAGRARWVLGHRDEARSRFEQSIDLAPSFAQAYANLAGLQVLRRDSAEALSNNTMAMALSPLDTNTHIWLATQMIALLELGRPEEAAACADRAIEMPHAMLGTMAMGFQAYHAVGRSDDAVRMAGLLKTRFPDLSASEVGQKYPVMTGHLERITEVFAAYGLRAD